MTITIQPISDGESGASVRAKLNQLIEGAVLGTLGGVTQEDLDALVDTEAPATPTGLNLAFVLTPVPKIVATWNFNDEDDFLNYVLQWREADGPWISHTVFTEYDELKNVLSNKDYSARIAAVDKAGNVSAYSSAVATTTVKDTIPPATPIGFNATAGFGNIWLTWNPNTESDLARYELIERATNTAPSGSDPVTFKSFSATFPRTGLGDEVTRYYWVRAVDTSENVSPWSVVKSAKTLAREAVTTEDLAGLVDATSFAAGITGIEIVPSLPTTGNFEGRTAVLTTDKKTYVYKNGAWSAKIESSDINGQIVAAQIASVQASQVTGQIIASQIASVTAAQITGQMTASQIADATLTAAKFAAGNRPVETVSTLPTTGNVEGRAVILSTDGLLYRYHSGAWTAAVPSGNISGQLTASQIASITAGQVTGQIIASQIADAAITVAKFASNVRPVETVSSLPSTGNVEGRVVMLSTDGKLYRYHSGAWSASVPSADISGQLTASQIASVNAASVAGQLTAAQIASIASTQITGQLTDSQIGAVAAAKVSGKLTASQIANAAIDATKLADNAVTANKIDASAITETKIADNAISTGKLQANSIVSSKIATNAILTDHMSANSVTVSKLLVTSAQNNLVRDPAFEDASWWSSPSTGTGPTIVSTPTAYQSGKVLRLTGGANTIYYDNHKIPIDPTKTYRLIFAVRNLTTGAGGFYGIVRCFDNAGGYIDPYVGDGWPARNIAGHNFYAPANAAIASSSNWTTFTYTVGPNGPLLLPANTAAIALGFITNYTGPADITTDVGLLSITEMADANLIVDGAITASKVAANSISATHIVAGAVTANEIAASTITGANIAGSTITGANIVAGTITTGLLAANSITTALLAANAVTTAKLAAGAVTANELGANSVVAGKIAAGIITGTEIAAKSIAADRLVLTSSDNLIDDPRFNNGLVGWRNIQSGVTLVTVTGPNGIPVKAIRFPCSTDNSAAGPMTWGASVSGSQPAVTPGTAFRFSVTVRLVSGTLGYFRLRGSTYEDYATAHEWPILTNTLSANTATPGQWVTLTGTYTVPANRTYFGIQLHNFYSSGTPDAVFEVCEVCMYRMATSELIVDGAVTANKVGANQISAIHIVSKTITANEIQSGTITGDLIAANTISATQIIAGSIGATELASNSVIAVKIAANVITGDKLVANSITGRELVLTDWVSLSNANFETGDFSGWTGVNSKFTVRQKGDPLSAVLTDPPSRCVVSILGSVTAAGSNYDMTNSTTGLCTGGDKFQVGFSAAAGGTGNAFGNVQLGLRFYRTDGTTNFGSGALVVTPASAWINSEKEIIAPLGATKFDILLRFNQTSSTDARAYFVTNLFVRRKSTANLIVDGAITTDKIAANAISTRHLLVTAQQNNIVRDPAFQDAAWWTSGGGSPPTIVTASDAYQGSNYLRSTAVSQTPLFDNQKVPIDPTKNYRITIVARDAATAGSFYGIWRFYDSAGNLIAPSSSAGWPGTNVGQFRYYAPSGVSPGTTWTNYTYAMGPDSPLKMPANTAYASWGWIGNYGGSAAANVDVGLISITEMTGGDLVVDGTITAAKINAVSIRSAILVADSIDSSMVKAKTISADKLFIGAATTNLVANPAGSGGDSSCWYSAEGGARTFDTSGPGYTGTSSFAISGAAGGSAYGSRAFPVTPGKTYAVRFAYRGSAASASGLYVRMFYKNSAPATDWLSGSDRTGYTALLPSDGPITTDWQYFSGTWTAPVGAVWANIAFYRWAGMGAASLYFDAVDVREQMSGVLIADGSIDASKVNAASVRTAVLTADSISSAMIQAGAIGADQIAVNAIRTKHLLIGDFENLLAGSDFENAAACPWQLINDYTIDNTVGHSGTSSLKIGTSRAGDLNYPMTWEVKGGDKLYLECWALKTADYNGTSSNAKIRYRFGSGAFGALSYEAAALSSTEWTKRTIVITVPAGETVMDSIVIRGDHTAGAVWLDDIVLRRMTAGNLIVDGAIKGNHLATDSAVITGTAQIANAIITNEKVVNLDASKIIANSILSNTITVNGQALGTIQANSVSGAAALAKFSGSGGTLPSGLLSDKFAASATQGGSALDSAALGGTAAGTINTAVINFNANNDRNGTTPATPTFAASAGSILKYAANTDGSVDIEFDWLFTTGTSGANDIDGFIVFVYSSTSASAYTITGTAAAENPIYVTRDQRSIVLAGAAADKYYTFGVRAYRAVDSDIDATGYKLGAIAKPTVSGTNPYRPSATVAFAGNLTGSVNGTAAATVVSNAALGAQDPAARVNAGSTKILPGQIQISSGAVLSDWVKGGDDTKIDGAKISAGTIAANAAVFGIRGIDGVESIQFEHNSPSTNKVSWTIGLLIYTDDTGATVKKTISASSATWNTGTLYIYYTQGANALSTTSSEITANGPNNIILATYKGGTSLIVNYGRTVIDGSVIKTGTITATQADIASFKADILTANSIIGSMIQGGTIVGTHIAAGTLTADKFNVTALSAVTSDIGTMTAGKLQNAAGTMVIDLTNGFISLKVA